MNPLEARLGVPQNLASCHTAIVNGYVIEGHVPAADIERLLAEKPAAKGLAVPAWNRATVGIYTKGCCSRRKVRPPCSPSMEISPNEAGSLQHGRRIAPADIRTSAMTQPQSA